MANERFWTGSGTLQFISNGGLQGQVQVISTRNIKVKQKILVKSNTQNSLQLEVKSVVNATDLILGPIGKPMRGVESYSDLTSYLVSQGATVTIEDQERPAIYMNEWSRAVFEEEPTVAIRTINVDELGNKYNENNPLPIYEAKNSKDFDKISITRDGDKDITKVVYKKNNVAIRTLDLTYDGDKDLIEVDKS